MFPDGVVDYLRALATIQTATATPILIPDLTMVSTADVAAAAQAAALVSGQTVIVNWSSLRFGPLPGLQPAGPEPETDPAVHYQFLKLRQLTLHVGEQELMLGLESTAFLSATVAIDNGQIIAHPFRNNGAHKMFSAAPDAVRECKQYEGRVLTRHSRMALRSWQSGSRRSWRLSCSVCSLVRHAGDHLITGHRWLFSVADGSIVLATALVRARR